MDYLFNIYFDRYLLFFNYTLYFLLIFKALFLIIYVLRACFFKKVKVINLQRETLKDDIGNHLFFTKKLFGDNIGEKLFFGNTIPVYILTFFYCLF